MRQRGDMAIGQNKDFRVLFTWDIGKNVMVFGYRDNWIFSENIHISDRTWVFNVLSSGGGKLLMKAKRLMMPTDEKNIIEKFLNLLQKYYKSLNYVQWRGF